MPCVCLVTNEHEQWRQRAQAGTVPAVSRIRHTLAHDLQYDDTTRVSYCSTPVPHVVFRVEVRDAVGSEMSSHRPFHARPASPCSSTISAPYCCASDSWSIGIGSPLLLFPAATPLQDLDVARGSTSCVSGHVGTLAPSAPFRHAGFRHPNLIRTVPVR